jgi:hypothetical protein
MGTIAQLNPRYSQTLTQRRQGLRSDEENPPASDWHTESAKMQAVCLKCHANTWTDDHFRNLDDVIDAYNTLYFDLVKTRMDQLYMEGILSKQNYFDEELEWQFYEFWHHDGAGLYRVARFLRTETPLCAFF